MNKNDKKQLADLEREVLASVNASGFAHDLKLGGIRQNPNGSVTLSFVSEEFKQKRDK